MGPVSDATPEREPAGHEVPTDPIAFAMYVQERLDRGEELEDVLSELDELDRGHAMKSRRAPRER